MQPETTNGPGVRHLTLLLCVWTYSVRSLHYATVNAGPGSAVSSGICSLNGTAELLLLW